MTVPYENNSRIGIAPDCYSCIINQTRSTARFAGLTEDQMERVIAIAKTWLEESKTVPLLAQHIIRYVGDAIIQELGRPPYFDIYAEVKERSNTLSLNRATIFQKKIADS